MGLTVSRHKRYFLPSTVKIVSKYFKSHLLSWYSWDAGSWRISKLEKPVLMFSKRLFLDITYPSPRGFSWFFFVKEINSKPRSGDNESRKRRGGREKPLVTLASNLTFMQTTAVKRVKLLIKRVTNGNLANTCLSAAIFLSGGRPGEIMLWTNHLHLGGKEWFVNRGQAKACVNDGRQESRNKKTTL